LFIGFPDMQQSIETIIAEDNGVAMRHQLAGTQMGVFLGIPPTGKQITGNGVRFFRIAAGKIVETWYECNLLAVMQQLGLMPA
jgi:predicted ester cyclase